MDGWCLFPTKVGRADIWIADPDGNNRKQLTANETDNFSPVVSADGRYIVFVSWRTAKETYGA